MDVINNMNEQQAAALLAEDTELDVLLDVAASLRDEGHRNLITYSKKVFIPLTHLCRDVCHYCTFAQTPKHVASPYLSIDQVLDIARRGAELGCKEALFTLGERQIGRASCRERV